jgi:undecaprenyl-diphosphatase
MMRYQVVLSLLLLAQSVAAGSIDEELYSKIHDGWRSPTMDDLMESMNRVGSRDVTLAMLLALSSFGDQKAKDASKLSVVSLTSGQLVCGLLKAGVNRDRPEGETGSRWNSSLPSGHAAGAFSLAGIFSSRYPRFKIPLYILATAVGVSRIYCGRHYPSDVLIGAVIGYSAARITLRFDDAILRFSVPGDRPAR